MLDSVRAAADPSSSPFVWIGREKVQSLLRWAGPFSQIKAGRQTSGAVRGDVKALLSPLISAFTITIPIL